MELDLETKQRLATLLAKPARVTPEDADLLANLVKSYPYYQPLHLLLAKATNDTSKLTTAALYNNGSLLHQIITEPTTLTPAENINIVLYPERKIESYSFSIAETDLLVDEKEIAHQTDSKADDFIENQETIVDEQEVFEEVNYLKSEAESIVDEQEVVEELDMVDSLPEAKIDAEEKELITDEQEVFEEIAEVDSSVKIAEIENIDKKESIADEQEVFEEIAEIEQPVSIESNTEHLTSPIKAETKKTETKDILIESIVSADFFAFEKSLNTDHSLESDTQEAKVIEPEEYDQQAEAESVVTKYDDDKLPFTFLWWLAKTRKDHEQIFQPYVTQRKRNNATELQQQYVEHIFHIQTPFNESKETAVNRPVTKEDEIIESFIKNEPQIKAPNPAQINNENKAKKSAEDNYDLVSETLASIYIEQMLYHKAIDTYEKLSLKFPEKSRYFADLIQSLEKKI